MATVFCVEDIAAGWIPAEGAADQAAARAVAVAEKYGGELLIHGSVGRSCANSRSDVDGVVVYDPECVTRVWWRESFARIQDDTHVPLNMTLLTSRDITDRELPLVKDPLLIEHLVIAQQESRHQTGNVTCRLKSIVDYPEDAQLQMAVDTTTAYLEHKIRKMMHAQHVQQLDVRVIQCGLELPASVARKVVRVLQIADIASGSVHDLLDRRDAEQALLSLADCDKRIFAAHALVELNAKYDAVLQRMIAGEMTGDEYMQWLKNRQQKIIGHGIVLLSAAQRLIREVAS